jgi:hypothetical protein
LKDQKGSLEFEMEIAASDFQLAWHDVDLESASEPIVALNKTRYCLHMPWHETWEIDFFKDSGSTYFVLAECELPSHIHPPKGMPDIVADNLIFTVPDNDPRFKNRRLADPIQTKILLHDLLAESAYGKAVQQDEAISLQSLLSAKHTSNAR